MKISTLEDLWYGNINPSTNRDVTMKELNLVDLIGSARSDLKRELPDNKKLRELIDNYDEYSQFVECEAFKRGFSLAAKIMIEILCDD